MVSLLVTRHEAINKEEDENKHRTNEVHSSERVTKKNWPCYNDMALNLIYVCGFMFIVFVCNDKLKGGFNFEDEFETGVVCTSCIFVTFIYTNKI